VHEGGLSNLLSELYYFYNKDDPHPPLNPGAWAIKKDCKCSPFLLWGFCRKWEKDVGKAPYFAIKWGRNLKKT
jgi:hypothetical protein